MCGVIGIIGQAHRDSDLDQAFKCIESRGPDDRTLLDLGDCVLGHTRLSIIDIHGGAQPFRSDCLRYTLTYNGEVYNYEEIRGELKAIGFSFRTQSDTEVVLKALMAWGVDALQRFDGIFAFGFWDAESKKLLLARDRLGVKPLFFCDDHEGFRFGSTARSVVALASSRNSLCPYSVADYFAFHTALSPRSMFRNIRQVEPGGYVVYDQTRCLRDEVKYWRVQRAAADEQRLFSEEVSKLDTILGATVRQQLKADVPIGIFLSGGVDSSLITHYASQHAAHPLQTYSVSFKGTAVDESSVAAEVARFYATTHTEIPLPDIDADVFVAAVASMDQPLSDPAYIPMYQMSSWVMSDVKVVLSGDGADELFGGYGRYLRDIARFPDSRLKQLMRAAIASGLAPGSLVRRSLHGRDALRYLKIDLDHLKGGRKAFTSWFNNDFLSQISDYVVMQHWCSEIDRLGDDIEGLMKSDWTTYLSENCLVKTDRSTMAFGLEGRVPFLGQSVVDYAESLTSSVNFAAGMKSLPTALAKRYLPASVWDRPKHGFTVPVARLFRSAWRDLVIDMASDIDRLAPFIDANKGQKLLHDAVSGSVKHPSLAYSLLVYLVWSDFHSVKYSDN